MDPNSSYLFICKIFKQENNQPAQCKKSTTEHIHPPSIVNTTPSGLPTLNTTRKPPKARVYRDDGFNSEAFKSMSIANFSEVNESIPKSLGYWFLFSKNEDCAIFHRFDTNSIPEPKVCEMIKIGSNLHVKLYSTSSPFLPGLEKGENTC